MSDIVLELINTLIIGTIFVYLLLVSAKQKFYRQKGWIYIIIGFGFVFLGDIFDFTDNFPSLNRYVIIGDTPIEAFIEKFIGRLVGYIFLFLGFLQWLPLLIRQRRTEDALIESEERYRYFVENARDVICAVSEDGTIVSLNPVFEKITGWSPAEWIGKHFSQIIHPADLPFAAGVLQSVLRGENPPMFELRTLTKSGGYLVGEFLVTPKIWNEEVIGMLGIVRDITERKQAEDALIESEERYRRLVELSPDVVFIQSEGRIAFINPAGVKFFGADSAEELIGKPVLELMHPDYRGIVNARIRILKEERTEVPVLEEKYLRLDGSSVDVEVAAASFIYRGKTGAQVIARDITERKKMENILQKERDKAQLYLDIAGVMLVAIDAEQRISLINKKGCEILGYCEEDIIGKNWFDNFVPERMRNEVEAIFNKMMRGETEPVEHYENPVLTKSGEEKLISWHNVLIADENGIISGTLSSGEDITGRKKAEEFIKNILETVDEGFIVIDNEYKIISANKSYLQAVNKPLEEVTGRHCYELSHHIYKPCHESGEDCPVNITFKTGEPHTALHTHYDSEGNSIFVETKSYPIKDDSGKVVSAIEVINNITEKKKLEDQLHHAQKMEAIGTFAGGIAHDFNNILTAIIGYANLLQMKMKKDEPLRAHVDPILASAERAANLTQSLLAFSRKQVINPKIINLNEVVGNVEKLLRRLIGEDIELNTFLADKPLTVMVDFGQMEQVLINLATNARDAMPDGGVLIIKTGMMKLDEEYIRSHGYGKTGKYAVILVTDTGSGMDEKTRERIFDPFFTTKDLGKGTGLGLSIVYGIIKQHNGYINVYSEPGKGTTFRIYLPLTKSKIEETKISEEAHSIGGTETILLAEDESDVREITKTVLEEFGYKVIEAVDGEDAVSKFTGSDGRIELLLFDVIMPKKNGKETYEEIKKVRPDIKVIFMSGYPADVIDKKGLFDERINFISKPISPTELLRNIREVLDKQAIS